ncbi:branched-chain amino acid ABC transporter permease [Desulfothermobacter acidiphilus]|uniref:branched-chain amino acid ABC transporter permease n=1 Tax=Desulfothermobacter acidiphilus TaxID=1938353 RepID=UPI003F8CE38D
MFWQLLFAGLAIGSIYALVALGFVLIYKASGCLNFAQGEFLLLGAYVALTLVTAYKVPFLPAVALTLGVAILVGLMVERLVLRPLIGEPIIAVIMVTLGLSVLMRGVFQAFWGTDTRVFPPIFPQEPITLCGVSISAVYLWSLGLALLLLFLLTLFFKYTTTGIAMRAVADDQQASLSVGINVKRIFGLTWAIAAVVAAVGGILLGNINGVNASLAALGLKVLPVVILGGLESIPGAVVGGFIIGLLESFVGGYLDPLVGGGLREVVPFIVLLLVLLVRPYGLFGEEIIERV